MTRITRRVNGKVTVDWTDTVLERLAEYEDTGLEPGEIESVSKFRESMKRVSNCNGCTNRKCGYRPAPGDNVRWNCPFWKGNDDSASAGKSDY